MTGGLGGESVCLVLCDVVGLGVGVGGWGGGYLWHRPIGRV